MGALAIGAAIGTIGSLIGTSMASKSAESTNSQAMSFTAGENVANRQFQSAMYERQQMDEERKYNRRFQMQQDASKELTDWLYKNFNSPSAQVSALRQAGINPSVAFASGGNGFVPNLQSSPETSVPIASGMSPATSNSVSLTPPGQYYAGSIKEIASAFAQIQTGHKSASETKTIDSTRDAIITDLVLKNSGQEIANQFSQFHLNLDKAFSERKIKAEIKKIEADAVTSFYSGKHQEALSKLVDIQSLLAKYQDKCNTAMLPYLEENCKQIALSYQFENRVKKAQEAAQRAMASASYSSANLSNAQTQTENELRFSKVNISKAQAREALNKAGISQHEFIRSVESMKHSENINKWRQQNPKAAAVLDAVGYTVESLSGPLIGGILKAFK